MNKYFIPAFCCLCLLTGCKPFKKPGACIEGPSDVFAGQKATYTWCGDDAREISWQMDEQKFSGKSIEIIFPGDFRGVKKITATGKNRYSSKSETSKDINVGKATNLWCAISRDCSENPVIYNDENVKYYKAYLYTSREKIGIDIKNRNHANCLDSVTCAYRPEFKKVGAYFRTQRPPGSLGYVSVEYRNPETPEAMWTNWHQAISQTNHKTNVVHFDNVDWTDVVTSEILFDAPSKVLRGKYKAVNRTVNGQKDFPDCMKNDYLVLYGDKTWKYFTGNDNCDGSQEEFSGTYLANIYCLNNSQGTAKIPQSVGAKVLGEFVFKNTYQALEFTIEENGANVRLFFEYGK